MLSFEGWFRAYQTLISLNKRVFLFYPNTCFFHAEMIMITAFSKLPVWSDYKELKKGVCTSGTRQQETLARWAIGQVSLMCRIFLSLKIGRKGWDGNNVRGRPQCSAGLLVSPLSLLWEKVYEGHCSKVQADGLAFLCFAICKLRMKGN